MVVEHFKGKDSLPDYRRFRDKRRMLPTADEGLIIRLRKY